MSESRDAIKKSLIKVIRVALVDDQPLFRAGITSLLKDYDNMEVVLEASNGKEFFERIKRPHPHVVLLDIEMPKMNGIETTRQLKERYPEIKIIILTMHNEEEFIFDLMTKGAHGFLPKDKSVEELVTAISGVIYKGKYYNDEVVDVLLKGSKGLVKNLKMNILTEREIEIIRMICKQKTNKEIGEALGVSVRTIENQRTTILLKTNTKNVAGVVMYALKHKLINRLEMM